MRRHRHQHASQDASRENAAKEVALIQLDFPLSASDAGHSDAVVRVHMTELFAASLGLRRPGKPNLVLETG